MKTNPKILADAIGIMRRCIDANPDDVVNNDYFKGCAIAIAVCFDHFIEEGYGVEILNVLNEVVEKMNEEDSK